MLVLSRKYNETLMIGDSIVKVLGIRDGIVRLGIKAPKEVPVFRGEAYFDRIDAPLKSERVEKMKSNGASRDDRAA